MERPGEIGIGVRDIGQIVSFVETVAQAVSPSGYGDYAAAKTQIERRLDVDVEKDILDQLSGDISASISLEGKFGVRVEPKDPAAFERTLEKIAGALPSLAEGLGLDDVSLVRPKGGRGPLRPRHRRRHQHRLRREERRVRDHQRRRTAPTAWPSTSRPRPRAWRARSWSRPTPSRSPSKILERSGDQIPALPRLELP